MKTGKKWTVNRLLRDGARVAAEDDNNDVLVRAPSSAQLLSAPSAIAHVSMLQSPPSLATPVQPFSASSSIFDGTPSLAAREMTEIADADIDAAVFAEFPVELRAGIIAQHRAVSRGSATTTTGVKAREDAAAAQSEGGKKVRGGKRSLFCNFAP